MNKQQLSNKERLQKDKLLSFLFGTDTEDIKNVSKFFEGCTPQFIFNTTKNNEAKESIEYKKSPNIEKQQQDSKVDSDKIVKPQKGDEVLILDSPEGIKNVKGIIVDEVRDMDMFLVKMSKLNACYFDKNNLKVTKKKQNVEEINKLKEKITATKQYKKELIDNIANMTKQIHDLEECKLHTQEKLSMVSKDLEKQKQQLEKLEGR